jgi:Protein of unknown function (DUF2569)
VRYAGNLGRVRDAAGYQLFWSDPAKDANASAGAMQHFNWLLALVGALVFAMWCWLATTVYRYDPKMKPVAIDRSPQRIGGWLILPAIGIVVTPFIYATALIKSSNAFATDTWSALTTYGNPHYHPMWAPCLLMELTAHLGFLVFSVLMAIVFFQRRRIAPKLFIALMIITLIYRLIDHAVASQLPVVSADSTVYTDIVRLSIASLIWISYFLTSARVKSTFVMERVRHVPNAMLEG